MEIKRLGSYQEVDEKGYLVKLADASKIQAEWEDAIDTLKQAYLEKWKGAIHSIYIRGSLAKGWAVKGVSDLDSFAVTAQGENPTEMHTQETFQAWAEALEKRIQQTHPYVAGIEVGLTDLETALDSSGIYAFMIKMEAVCIHGEDLAEQLPTYKPGPEIAFQTRHFQQHFDMFLEEYPNEPENEKAEFLNWMLRRFLRLGMELVMAREGRYTRDLYLCYESFSKHYPEKQEEMYRALELAVNPTVSEESFNFVRDFGAWLADEAQRKLESM